MDGWAGSFVGRYLGSEDAVTICIRCLVWAIAPAGRIPGILRLRRPVSLLFTTLMPKRQKEKKVRHRHLSLLTFGRGRRGARSRLRRTSGYVPYRRHVVCAGGDLFVCLPRMQCG